MPTIEAHALFFAQSPRGKFSVTVTPLGVYGGVEIFVMFYHANNLLVAAEHGPRAHIGDCVAKQISVIEAKEGVKLATVKDELSGVVK